MMMAARRLLAHNHAHVIIDVSNVMGALPKLQWWKNRTGATQTILDQVVKWNYDTGKPHRVSFVIEGAVEKAFCDGAENHGVTVVHSKFVKRNACDDAIVNMVLALDQPTRESSLIITSDRLLRERLEQLGCNVVGVRRLLDAMHLQKAL